MRLLRDQTNSAQRRATAIVLLCLVVFAFAVNIAHHHRSASPSFNHLIGIEQDSGATPDSSSDADCPSCCLQRVCASIATPAALVVELPVDKVSSQPLRALLRSSRPSLIFSSRAPPRT